MAIKAETFSSRDEAMTSTEKSSGGGGVIWGIPKDGCLVRFMTDSVGWLGYLEYWNEDGGGYVPVDEDDALPDGARVSKRYLANVVWLSEGNNKGKVVPFKMPKTLAKKVLNKEKRYDGLTDRDYEFTKMGTGTDTEYDLDVEPPKRMSFAKLKPLDLLQVLVDERSRVLGLTTDDEDEPKAAPARGKAVPVKGAAKSAKAAPKKAPVEDDEVDYTSLGKLGDKNDFDAIDTLTELAEEAGVDPDDYKSWADLAAELAETAGMTGEDDEDDEEEDEEVAQDLLALGKSADRGDDAAVDALTAAADLAQLDPDDYPTWVELAEALLSDDESEDDEDEDEDTDEDDDDEEEVDIDEESLSGMSVAELVELAEAAEIETKGITKNKKKLIAAIIEAAEG